MKRSKYAVSGCCFISILISLSITSCSTQKETVKHDFEIVELKKYYNGKGAIVSVDTKDFIPSPGNCKRIYLKIEQIEKAEKIICDSITNYTLKMYDEGKFYFSTEIKTKGDSISAMNEIIKKEKEIIKEYYRQYVGYVNDKHEELVGVSLFNFGTGISRSKFNYWQDHFIFGAGEYFEENTRTYLINLTKGRIE
jgi:hypothetical protein